jgi:ribosomal protein S21
MYGVVDTKGGMENIERMLRRFKRVAESAGILAELKKRRSYEKPSEQKRRKRKDAIRKAMLDKFPQKRKSRRDREERDQDRGHYEY